MVRRTMKEFEVHPYVQFMADRYGAYRRWIQSEGIPIFSGSHVEDVRTLEVGAWARKGGKGAYLSFSDQLVADGYVAEIAPAGQLVPQRQLFEEIVLIAAGRGATTLWYDGTPKRTIEWETGSLFAIPLNAWHQHFNASGTRPARYFALTSAPIAFELFRDPEFIFNTSHLFKDRFDPSDEDFFSKPGQYLLGYYGGIFHSNFVSDIRAVQLVPREQRGKGNRNMYFHMAGGTMLAHVSQFPVGTYKKAHRHGPGAHIYILDSTGYSLMWKDGESPRRFDWHEGSVLSPPAGSWHQHFNTGRGPCRFVALHASSAVQREEGGVEQLEFEDEDPDIRKRYEDACAKNGVTVDM